MSQLNIVQNEENAIGAEDGGLDNGFMKETMTTPSEEDFDDELAVPHSLTIISVEGTSVAIQRDEEDACVDCPTGKVRFNIIHNPPVKFSSFHRDIFIPGEEIKVTITDNERNLTTHLLNPNLYTIAFSHGDYSWQLKKRYKHIQSLHQQLTLFRTSLNIPFPTKSHRRQRQTFRNTIERNQKGKRKGLPRFPKKPEVLIPYDQLGTRMKQLEDYLTNLLAINIYRNHPETIAFLEVSHLSFIYGLGIKGKEGHVKKRNGGTKTGCNCFGLCHSTLCMRCSHLCNDLICSSWNDRWFFIKDTCFGYVNPKNGRVNCVVLFDQGFEVGSGMYATGLHKGLQIITLSRQIAIKCSTRRQSKEWLEALKRVANTQARDFSQPNPHRSFAPARNNVTANWFVDGAGYMAVLADALENAKEEIFIADWWLSPEIYLKRPVIEGDYWRLDKLLERKAKEGVKIFVLLYKEVEMALGLNSYYSKQRLASISENVKVLRHPDHAKVGVLFWAHHEKIVVIDQGYAFLGGIDLCYGRWDDHKHRLTDLGSLTPTVDLSIMKKKTSSVPGGDNIYPIPIPYYKRNPPPPIVIEPSVDHDSPDGSPLPQLQPGDNLLMPQTPEGHLKCNTPELERKNVLTTIKHKGKNFFNMFYTPEEDSMDVELEDQKQEPILPIDLLENLDGSSKLWVGKDYVNFIVKDFTNLEAPFADFIDRSTTPRMPWHDIGMCVQGAGARDVARHFIQRWNATKLEKARLNISYPYLFPKSYNDCTTVPIVSYLDNHKVTCQVLRSVSTWSCGFLEPDTVEQSIHEAYIDTITRAQHYIYIENQFFISLSYGNPDTRNQIGEALFKRILRAHKNKETFRVFVVMPLLPGFEGEVGGRTGTSLHAITHWNYASISRGKDAIINRLKKEGIDDPSAYITFFGLRTHSELNGEPITELIYVHSKLMIVDDKIVICGSANINDRSLIGKRDSEIAVLIEDEAFDDGIMNGASFPSGKFVGSLRQHLFKEHLGLLGKENEMIDIDVTDPISEYFYRHVWYDVANLNTELYEKVFHCIPSDKVDSFATLKKYQEEKPLYTTEISRSEQMLKTIRGHLVLLPLEFLKSEILTPNAGTVEGIMPTSLWT